MIPFVILLILFGFVFVGSVMVDNARANAIKDRNEEAAKKPINSHSNQQLRTRQSTFTQKKNEQSSNRRVNRSKKDTSSVKDFQSFEEYDDFFDIDDDFFSDYGDDIKDK